MDPIKKLDLQWQALRYAIDKLDIAWSYEAQEFDRESEWDLIEEKRLEMNRYRVELCQMQAATLYAKHVLESKVN